MTEEKTSCVACGHPIPIDHNDPCPKCTKKNPRYKNVVIKDVIETTEKFSVIQSVYANDHGKFKEIFKLNGYKVTKKINKLWAFVFAVITAFSIILLFLPVSNSWVLLYMSTWDATIIGFILLILGIFVGFKAFTEIEKPHESEF
jgi:polyferredoxin